MKIFISNYKSLLLLFFFFYFFQVKAQKDSAFIKRIPSDTTKDKMNMDAIYNRPFLSAGKLPIAIGGYLEANTHYGATDGVSEGFSFQMRRMTLFFSSTIARNIKFLSELEFEDGTKEINIEFAAMDIEFHPFLNLRGGIIMNPIGAFNQNHDGPRWEFIDRPISATRIIPSTLSNAGFGIYGKYFTRKWMIGYETYLSNGFDDRIISNEENRTSLSAGKSNPEKFEESNSGLPMFTGKIAVRNRNYGEVGISYMTGVYNKFMEDGLMLDKRRKMGVFAIDFNTSLLRNRLNITGEYALVNVDVPETYIQTFGNKQSGGFIDFVATLYQRPVRAWNKAKINFALRLEYADFNREKFAETGGKIGDEIWAVVPGISFRPAGSTVLRFNYRYFRETDIFRNDASRSAVIQFGFSTYF